MKKMLKMISTLLIFTLLITLAIPFQKDVKAKDQSYSKLKQVDQTETSVTVDWTTYLESLDWLEPDRFTKQTLFLFEEYNTKEGEEIETFEVDVLERNYTLEGLKPGKMYTVKYVLDYTYGISNSSSFTSTSGQIYTLPGKVTGINQSKWWYWAEKCDVTWDKQSGVDGYEYEVRNHKKKKIAKENPDYNSSNSASFSIKNNIVYTIRARAFTELNGKKYTGKWSNTAYCFTQPMVQSVSYDKKGGMTIKWNKVNGCDEYSVYVSKKENKGFKKVKTVKSKVNSMRIDKISGKKVSAKNTYFLYIVGTKKVKGKKYTSGKNYLHTIKNGYVKIGYID